MNSRTVAFEIRYHSNHRKLITAMKVQRNQRFESNKTTEENVYFLKSGLNV